MVVDERETELRASRQSRCYVCGADNDKGLRIGFQQESGGAMWARWTPGCEWEGFSGIVHGGVVSAVLDEAMSKSVAATNTEALTGELRIRFRHHVASGRSYIVRGWIVMRRRRLTVTEASLTACDGTECAHAWARFLSLPSA